MAHRSWCAEHPGTMSNERLEYLGDAVLGWVVADLAYRWFGDLGEGALTGVRKGVVNAQALAHVARTLRLGEHVLLGRGEDAAGGRDKPSILSDALEAVFAAVYLDGGPAAAHELIERLVGPRLRTISAQLDQLDHKSRLQEMIVQRGGLAPTYTSTSEGPDHAKQFTATVWSGTEAIGTGQGASKKVAEQNAAKVAVGTLH
ncbi:MAG: ribonuclease III [Acidimicrobiia bacterium]|nr:ribonuclease III [Acidimicrobiia bacterium]